MWHRYSQTHHRLCLKKSPLLTQAETVESLSKHSPCPWTSPCAPASSGRIWTHPCSRRCSWGQRTTSASSGLDREQQYPYITVSRQNITQKTRTQGARLPVHSINSPEKQTGWGVMWTQWQAAVKVFFLKSSFRPCVERTKRHSLQQVYLKETANNNNKKTHLPLRTKEFATNELVASCSRVTDDNTCWQTAVANANASYPNMFTGTKYWMFTGRKFLNSWQLARANT